MNTKLFAVPYNGDLFLIESLSSTTVREVYGRPTIDGIGGGRASLTLPHDISCENIEGAVKLSHQKNIKFHYVANSPLITEDKMIAENRTRVIEEIQWAKEIGVDAIIVSTPFLASLSASMGLPFIVSKLARVKTIDQIAFWIGRGANQICLDLNIIRNFDLLKRMRDRAGHCNLQLLVNDACLFKCPYDDLHSRYSSLASQPGVKYNHQYSFKCIGKHFIEKPQEFIRATYIRPEDLQMYQSLGFDNFKLVDRNRPTHWLLNVISAYAQRTYKGNLADLLSLFSAFGATHDFQVKSLFDGVNTSAISAMRQALPIIMDVFIDNKKLQGVLEHMQRINCETQICDVTCNFCKRTAQEVVSVRGEKEARHIVNNAFNLLKTSRGRLQGQVFDFDVSVPVP